MGLLEGRRLECQVGVSVGAPKDNAVGPVDTGRVGNSEINLVGFNNVFVLETLLGSKVGAWILG